MRRSKYVIVVVVLLALLAPSPVSASMWCRSDPVVSLNGTIVDISVDIPVEYILSVNGPVSYAIETPSNVAQTVVAYDVGYNGNGVQIHWTIGSASVDGKRIPTTISVVIPTDSAKRPPGTTIPARLNVFPHNGQPVTVEGTTDLTRIDLWIVGQ